MAEATNRPPVKTPLPQRDDLQRLIPDNVRLRRALEQLFTDVNTTLPDAIQTVGDNSQAVTEDVSMGLFGATDRKAARLLADLADAKDQSDHSALKRIIRRIDELEALTSDIREPVKARIQSFIAPTLLNSWVNFGAGFNPAGYYKDPFGIVHLRGLVSTGVVGSNIFVLPAGYRPTNVETFVSNSNNAFGRIDVQASGNVILQVGSNVFASLDGMTFRAA